MLWGRKKIKKYEKIIWNVNYETFKNIEELYKNYADIIYHSNRDHININTIWFDKEGEIHRMEIWSTQKERYGIQDQGLQIKEQNEKRKMTN
jgi:hypothetical protein